MLSEGGADHEASEMNKRVVQPYRSIAHHVRIPHFGTYSEKGYSNTSICGANNQANEGCIGS